MAKNSIKLKVVIQYKSIERADTQLRDFVGKKKKNVCRKLRAESSTTKNKKINFPLSSLGQETFSRILFSDS